MKKVKQGDEKHEDHEHNVYNRAHKIVGPIVVSLIILQLLWAFLGKRVVPWQWWYLTHVTLAVLIVCLGWTNLWLGYQMSRS